MDPIKWLFAVMQSWSNSYEPNQKHSKFYCKAPAVKWLYFIPFSKYLAKSVNAGQFHALSDKMVEVNSWNRSFYDFIAFEVYLSYYLKWNRYDVMKKSVSFTFLSTLERLAWYWVCSLIWTNHQRNHTTI